MYLLQIILAAFFIALIITSIGFKKTVLFISLGYTFSIIAFCITFACGHYASFQYYNVLQLSLLFLWASRLGYFLVKREANEYYRNNVQEQTGSAQQLPFIAKFGIWVSVSVLYACMFSPAIFSIQPVGQSTFKYVIIIMGLTIGFAGLIIEAIADQQKTAFKKLHPRDYCDTGLYQWIRCPNYFGEIMVWLGNFICGLFFFLFWWQWLIAATGLVCILLIMMGSAKRLEKKQGEKYWADKKHQQYCKTVPILFPWIPLYSLQKIKVYLE